MNPKKKIAAGLLIVAALGLSFCRKEKPGTPASTDSAHVPVLPDRVEPFPNQTNYDLAILGRVLFYDKELSVNKNVACGSCHKQENAFTDNLQFSPGTREQLTERNTPSIFARNGKVFWDGRANSLRDMALMPVRNDIEMGHRDLSVLITRVTSLDYYKPLLARAFPGATRLDTNMLKRALEEFMRSFRFTNNKYFRSLRGEVALNDTEERGRQLFFGNALCSNCHVVSETGANGQVYYGPTDEFHNIGLDIDNPDRGLGAVTGNSTDDGRFLMPVLLNVELTAPYMHDGRFKTLDEVVEHYNSEVKPNPNLAGELMNWDRQPKRLNLTDADKVAIVAFLKTLTDHSILTDARFSNPFVPRTN
jgi:cytochrome c peroxidase